MKFKRIVRTDLGSRSAADDLGSAADSGWDGMLNPAAPKNSIRSVPLAADAADWAIETTEAEFSLGLSWI